MLDYECPDCKRDCSGRVEQIEFAAFGKHMTGMVAYCSGCDKYFVVEVASDFEG